MLLYNTGPLLLYALLDTLRPYPLDFGQTTRIVTMQLQSRHEQDLLNGPTRISMNTLRETALHVTLLVLLPSRRPTLLIDDSNNR